MRKRPPYRDLSSALRDLGIAHGDRLAAQELRARVRRALATFHATDESRVQARRSRRQEAIISRCDLGGELHKVVAADLRISMRTLYRDRIEGFARLREALSVEPVDVPAPVARDGIALRIERAWEQVLLGHTREAIVRLEEITASAPPALLAVAYARLATARYLASEDVWSSDALSRAKRALAVLGPGAASAVAEAEIDIVEGVRFADEGLFERALHAYERAAAVLQSHAPSAVGTALLVTAGRIDAHVARGDAASAFELARSAEDPSDPALPVALAHSTLVLGGDAAAVQTDALGSYAAATARGAAIVAVRALRVAAQASAALFDITGALAHLREAATIVRHLPRARESATAALELASAFAEFGDGESTLSLLHGCAISSEGEHFTAGLARAAEAEALIAEGHHAEAAVRAKEAYSVLSRFESRRAIGETLLISALASHGCGDWRRASIVASQAAPLLRGSTWPTRVARARRLAAGRRMSRAHVAKLFSGSARAG